MSKVGLPLPRVWIPSHFGRQSNLVDVLEDSPSSFPNSLFPPDEDVCILNRSLRSAKVWPEPWTRRVEGDVSCSLSQPQHGYHCSPLPIPLCGVFIVESCLRADEVNTPSRDTVAIILICRVIIFIPWQCHKWNMGLNSLLSMRLQRVKVQGPPSYSLLIQLSTWIMHTVGQTWASIMGAI